MVSAAAATFFPLRASVRLEVIPLNPLTKRISVVVLAAAMLGGTAAFAFSDISQDPAQTKIESLRKDGVLSGMDGDRFAPKEVLTYDQGIRLLVKGLDLSLAHISFIKAPKASDYYTHVPDDAWYAEDFIIAQHNGLELPQDVDPSSQLTREQFAVLLNKAIQQKGNFAVIELFNILEDEDAIDPAASGSIQTLLNMRVIKLEKAQFRPKAGITRSEAADWLYEARAFVASHTGGAPSSEPSTPAGTPGAVPGATPVPGVTAAPPEDTPLVWSEAAVSLEKAADGVNKALVTIQVPHPGYGAVITGIEFTGDKEAVIRYRLTPPDPDMMYPMVVSKVELQTYVSSEYTSVTAQQVK
ncbi:hypothetical protein DQG13_25305 [Paenibacillus sp. YN15]|nr:hypothetical protein DQG13_25305 [Paenibacillus sp. YN15]